MALDEREIHKLLDDFRSGRNPKAYIPLCQQLRRDRRFAEAFEYCQQGLAADSRSLAGRTLHARLLADLGRYDEALEEVRRSEAYAPEELSLLVVKAMCQVHLRQLDEADETLAILDRLYPLEPQVKLLLAEQRNLRQQHAQRRMSREVAVPTFASAARIEELARTLQRQLAPLAKVHTVGIVDLDSARTHVEGSAELVEAGAAFFQDVTISCAELERGIMSYGLVELRKALVMVFFRERRLIIMAIDPEANFGKVHHRVLAVIRQYLPGSRPAAAREKVES